MKETANKALTLKMLNKSNVWDIQENDIFRMLKAAEKDADLKENMLRYTDIIKSAFDIEEVKVDRPEVIKKYEARGFKIAKVGTDGKESVKWAVRKHPILRVTDLTYENIGHISAAKLVEVLDRNFGGGWESLSQSIQDIIQHGFDISTTTLPADRLHKKGGMYEKKVADGFEVLEIQKGSWVEAIFAKEKPRANRQHTKFDIDDDGDVFPDDDGTLNDDDEITDTYEQMDDEDEYDEDKLTEESYRTTIEEDPEALSLEATEIVEDDGF